MADSHPSNVKNPPDLLKYIELFRIQYIPYEAYDQAVDEYLRAHVARGPLRILSLGCGTGQHEVNLARMGHSIVGIDKDPESLQRAAANALAAGVNLEFRQADLLLEAEIKASLAALPLFDVAIMFGVGLSMRDHASVGLSAREYLRVGGAFVAGLWGYTEGFDPQGVRFESAVEIAGAEHCADFAVRLNSYRYYSEEGRYYIDWDAVYLYPGQDSAAVMHRWKADRLEVAPQRCGEDPLSIGGSGYELLPSRPLHECSEVMCFPHTYEYLVGWRRS